MPLKRNGGIDAYSGLVRAYEELFPVHPGTVGYLARAGLANRARVLDVGCASGAHPRAFAAAGYRVVGIDPSEAMIEAARASAAGAPTDCKPESGPSSGPKGRPEAPRFETAGMLDLERLYPTGTWDAVTCLGNTLPHLRDEAEAEEFLRQARSVLVPGGFLVLQFLNYRRILAERPERLPRLEAGAWVFERSYRYGDGFVEFLTRLMDRSGRTLSEGRTRLLPIFPESVADLAEGRGFRTAALESGWAGEPFDPVSSNLVLFRFTSSDQTG